MSYASISLPELGGLARHLSYPASLCLLLLQPSLCELGGISHTLPVPVTAVPVPACACYCCTRPCLCLLLLHPPLPVCYYCPMPMTHRGGQGQDVTNGALCYCCPRDYGTEGGKARV